MAPSETLQLLALHSAPNPMMIADDRGIITYVNPAAEELMRSVAEHLPIDVDKLVGTPIDRFHRAPGYGTKPLPPEGIKGTIAFGETHLSLHGFALIDGTGTTVGTAVRWEDVSERVRQEQEKAAVEEELRQQQATFDADTRRLRAGLAALARGDVAPLSTPFLSELEEARADFNGVVNQLGHFLIATSQVVQAAKEGNLTHQVDSAGMEGAFAELMAMQGDLLQSIHAPLAALLTQLEHLAEGDFHGWAPTHFEGVFGRLCSSYNAAQDALNELLLSADSAAGDVSDGMTQMSDASSLLSSGSNQQAASIQQIARSTQEVAAQAAENAGRASTASDAGRKARDRARTGQQQMSELRDAMESISSSSRNVARILRSIDEIAFQTNLLALNAAVEAARAGEHGRGFAVVAEEVRNLASRSAESAKETGELLSAALASVDHGTQLTEKTTEAFAEIMNGVAQTADLVEQISEASQQQSEALANVQGGLEEVNAVVNDNAGIATELEGTAAEIANRAVDLKERLSVLKLVQPKPKNGKSQLSPEMMQMFQAFMAQHHAGKQGAA